MRIQLKRETYPQTFIPQILRSSQYFPGPSEPIYPRCLPLFQQTSTSTMGHINFLPNFFCTISQAVISNNNPHRKLKLNQKPKNLKNLKKIPEIPKPKNYQNEPKNYQNEPKNQLVRRTFRSPQSTLCQCLWTVTERL